MVRIVHRHPAARRWFESLAESGQSAFYEPSDWATAYVLAETMSRELRPRVVGVTKDGDVIKLKPRRKPRGGKKK